MQKDIDIRNPVRGYAKCEIVDLVESLKGRKNHEHETERRKASISSFIAKVAEVERGPKKALWDIDLGEVPRSDLASLLSGLN